MKEKLKDDVFQPSGKILSDEAKFCLQVLIPVLKQLDIEHSKTASLLNENEKIELLLQKFSIFYSYDKVSLLLSNNYHYSEAYVNRQKNERDNQKYCFELSEK